MLAKDFGIVRKGTLAGQLRRVYALAVADNLELLVDGSSGRPALGSEDAF